jgi:hypothetical protein
MEISACPACGTTDIRYERTTLDKFKLDSWRSGDLRPVFVAEPEAFAAEVTGRIICVNGHAHPDRVGFDLEWSDSI